MAFERCDRGRGKYLVGTMVCAVILASCSSSSDPILQLGLTSEELAAARNVTPGASADMIAALADTGEDGAIPLPATRPEAAAAAANENATQGAAALSGKQASSLSREAGAAALRAGDDEGESARHDADERSGTAAGKRGFLSAFFSFSSEGKANAASRALDETAAGGGRSAPAGNDGETASGTPETPQTSPEERTARKPVKVASNGPVEASLFVEDSLPGVRADESLFDISSKSSLDDTSDIDIYENTGSYQVASAAGMARMGPYGLLKQRESVETACLKPRLVRILKTLEAHYRRRLVVTSGYRSPEHNRAVNGARHSLHMSCAAADIQLAGVSKWELARFVRALPGRGGVGTYCHTNSIHVDVGPERDWNWRCGRRK